MYTYVKSVVLVRTIGAQWRDAQLGTMSVKAMYQDFSRIIHVVTHPTLPDEIYVDADALRTEFAGYTGTLTQWWVDIDDRALPTVDELPTSTIRYIQYRDANQAGYIAHLAKIGENHPELYPKTALDDIALTRPGSSTDVTQIHTRALVTVNGMLHLTDTDGTILYVKDAAKSSRVAKEVSLGIISFMDLAAIEKIQIKDEMLFKDGVNRPYYEHVDIKLPHDIGDKTPLLSIGGYLFLPEENVCWVNGTDTVSLSLAMTPLVNRIYESRELMDLSSLDLTEDPNNPGVIDYQELISDAVMVKYLSLSQSFVILVDTPNFFHRKLFIDRMGVPNIFTTLQEPVYPLVTGYGRLSEYWKQKQDDRWAIHITDGSMDNRLLDYRNRGTVDIINDQRYPNRTYSRSHAYFLEIGSYV